MNQKQRECLDHVIDALDNPTTCSYKGMAQFAAYALLSDKLKEIKKIDDYDRAIGIII